MPIQSLSRTTPTLPHDLYTVNLQCGGSVTPHSRLPREFLENLLRHRCPRTCVLLRRRLWTQIELARIKNPARRSASWRWNQRPHSQRLSPRRRIKRLPRLHLPLEWRRARGGRPKRCAVRVSVCVRVVARIANLPAEEHLSFVVQDVHSHQACTKI